MTIATTLEQSRELLDLGLDQKTADMHWWPNGNGFQLYPIPFTNDGSVPDVVEMDIVPAWSVSALMELIPNVCVYREDLTHYACSFMNRNPTAESDVPLMLNNIGGCNTPVEAAFKMVRWLLEEGETLNDN